MCVGLGVSDLRDIHHKINTMNMMAESYPAMEKVCLVIVSFSTKPCSRMETKNLVT